MFLSGLSSVYKSDPNPVPASIDLGRLHSPYHEVRPQGWAEGDGDCHCHEGRPLCPQVHPPARGDPPRCQGMSVRLGAIGRTGDSGWGWGGERLMMLALFHDVSLSATYIPVISTEDLPDEI